MGGIIGLFMVYLGTFAVKAAIDIQIVLDIKNIIIGITTSVTIGIISGIIPAYSASRLDPVEAIRSN
jgi:putative ABC transport system permease protein